jgi:hypothetical protein
MKSILRVQPRAPAKVVDLRKAFLVRLYQKVFLVYVPPGRRSFKLFVKELSSLAFDVCQNPLLKFDALR